MFGLSVGKILLVLVAVVVLLLGSKILRQLNRNSGGTAPDERWPRSDAPAGSDMSDLIQCRACGAFAAGNCGKSGCPLA